MVAHSSFSPHTHVSFLCFTIFLCTWQFRMTLTLIGLKSHVLLRHLCSALYLDFFNEQKILSCTCFVVKGKCTCGARLKVGWREHWQMFYLDYFLAAAASDRMDMLSCVCNKWSNKSNLTKMIELWMTNNVNPGHQVHIFASTWSVSNSFQHLRKHMQWSLQSNV